MNIDLSTGAGFRAARLQNGLTQAQVAAYSGVTQSYIAQLEQRRTIPLSVQARMREMFAVHSKGEHAPPMSELEQAYNAVLKALSDYHVVALRCQILPPAPKTPLVPNFPDLDALLDSAADPKDRGL